MTEPILGTLVAGAVWPDDVKEMAEAAILEVPALGDSLAHNFYISEQTWMALYPTSPLCSARRAKALTRGTLSDTQCAHVADHETRSSILEKVMWVFPLSVANQERIACGKGLSQKTAEILRCADWADSDCAARACKKAGDLVMLRWLVLADQAACSTEEAEELLSVWAAANPSRSRIGALTGLMDELVERRPDLIPFGIQRGYSFSELFRAVCASRHLGDAQMQARIVTITALRLDKAFAEVSTGTYAFGRCDNALSALIRNVRVGSSVLARAKRLIAKTEERGHKLSFCATSIEARARGSFSGHCVDAAFEEYTRPAELLALADEHFYSSSYTVLAVAKNPYLDEARAEKTAMYLARLDSTRQVTAGEYKAAQDALFGAWPKLANLRVNRPARSSVRTRRPAWVPLEAKPCWFAGDLMVNPTNMYDSARQTVYVQPQRYPLSLALLSTIKREQHMAGVVAYISGRLGQQQGAWRAFFTLAPDLADSDLDSLIDSAIALNF
jgi:hypothetical protein